MEPSISLYPWIARIAAAAVFSLSLVVTASGGAPTAQSATGIPFPAPAGTEWRVASGYNTATHSVADGDDPYALDIVRIDGPTGGTTVLAPVDGRIQYIGDSGSRCVGLNDANDVRFMLCHLNPNPALRRGDDVRRGEALGTVAEAGDAANNGLAHIHYAVSMSGEPRGWGMGESIAFAGTYAIEGINLPALASANAHSGVTFVSSNIPNRRPTVDAGADVYAAPGGAVSIRATGTDADAEGLTYVWAQTAGPTVEFTANGALLEFVAPEDDGGLLTFAVTAIDPSVLYASDQVDVFVTSTPPDESEAAAPVVDEPGDEGRMLSGALPANGGFGAVLFGGGTNEALLAAAECTTGARFWATDGGRFVAYIPGAAAFVNASWTALFPSGIPARTILIGQCS